MADEHATGKGADPAGSSTAKESGPGQPMEETASTPAQVTPEGTTSKPAQVSANARTDDDRPFGRLGRPFNHRSPFFIGMAGAAGIAVTYALIQLVISVRDVLVLIGLAMFLAIGLNPAVEWLVRKRLPRWAAVTAIVLATLGLAGGFLALAIPALVDQGGEFAKQLPGYVHSLQDRHSVLGSLNQRLQIEKRITELTTSGTGLSLAGGLLGAGRIVLSTAASILIVCVLMIYFLADLPRITGTLYRCIPRSRRARAVLITDQVLMKVGAYVLGNLITSVIAGVATFLWLVILGVPYPALLGLFVALIDLVPVVGSTIGGVVVCLVALLVSFPVALATLGFYIAYRFVEDYLIVPKIMGKAVDVPGVVTVLAVLIGGALLGIVGALVAIPVAAAIRLLLNEIAFPRLDRS
ncbi:AI-2E family transporter [Planotetraspora phitsanulokensis]|uniref:AI-2E family transporter n=1 Tax=Planotetraspora phitsanulokensis TaxID=575192 RepID=A0A8J3XGT7_9ACTN|nr:AI-2E family transporter [Planotetraspora phitsanulokensis]GII40474.1 AI-2E family transporter [Planotetraspora phitsanulokensis]